MSWHVRFRRSVKLMPGLRLNINTRSASMTVGRRGVHYTKNLRTGLTTRSFGIPGTGISWRKQK
jgi:hypothetical protein